MSTIGKTFSIIVLANAAVAVQQKSLTVTVFGLFLVMVGTITYMISDTQ